MENKLFIGFGIITMLSGIYFIVQGQYLEGICGASVGAFLVYLNLKKINNKNEE
jgi:hypothetical protein